MKKILLSVAFLGATFVGVNAQVFQSDNFNSYTVGDLGTDITGETPGQGDWYTFTSGEGGANSDFQIFSEGGDFGNILQINGSSTTENKFAWQGGLDTAWASRTTGNDILKVKLDFYTGSATSSVNQYRIAIGAEDPTDESFKTIAGFTFNASTKVFQGLCYLNNAGTYNTYLINFATGGLVLPADTWIDVEIIFNSTTGEVFWISQAASVNGSYDGAAAGFPVLETTLINVGGTGNTVSSSFKVDNFKVGAVANEEDTLSTQQLEVVSSNFSVYPNPVKDILNISNSNGAEISSLTIVDINGRTVKQINSNISQINISDLNAGVYFVNINSTEGNLTKKIVKQ